MFSMHKRVLDTITYVAIGWESRAKSFTSSLYGDNVENNNSCNDRFSSSRNNTSGLNKIARVLRSSEEAIGSEDLDRRDDTGLMHPLFRDAYVLQSEGYNLASGLC